MTEPLSQQALLEKIKFDERGLITAVAQDATTGQVLMVAWMNKDSLQETLKTGRVCYWSRSRGELWRKGDTSGNTQHLKELFLDCDGDTLLLKVQQKGPACHTGAISCFFSKVNV
jgi:phosphoribosyl-AMP cyclohydrolase